MNGMRPIIIEQHFSGIAKKITTTPNHEVRRMGPNTTSNSNQTMPYPAQTGQLSLDGMCSAHDLLEHDNKSERPIGFFWRPRQWSTKAEEGTSCLLYTSDAADE